MPLPIIPANEWLQLSGAAVSGVATDMRLLKNSNGVAWTQLITPWNTWIWDDTNGVFWILAAGGDSDGADNGVYRYRPLTTQAWDQVKSPTLDLIPYINNTQVNDGTGHPAKIVTTLAGAIPNASATGVFPVVNATNLNVYGQPSRMSLGSASTGETVTVSAIDTVGNTITITARGVIGTPQAWGVGTAVGPIGPPAVYTDIAGQYGAVNGEYPSSRHTYLGEVFMPTLGQVWVSSGAGWFGGGSHPGIEQTWHYDTTALTWTRQASDPAPADLISSLEAIGCWDSHGQQVLAHGTSNLWRYSPTLTAGSRYRRMDNNSGSSIGTQSTCLFDTKRYRYVLIGSGVRNGGGAGLVYYDFLTGTPGSLPRTNGDVTGVLSNASLAGSPGAAYDVYSDTYLLWYGETRGDSTNTIYQINPDTFVATRTTLGGTTAPAFSANGNWNKLRYMTSEDAYGLLADSGTVYAFRLGRTQASLTPSVFNSFQGANDIATGIALQDSRGMKHVTMVENPLDGRVYMKSGDWADGFGGNQSYRNGMRSLDVSARVAAGLDPSQRDVGWRSENTGVWAGADIGTKMTDFFGFAWDTVRSLFWSVPGVSVTRSADYPGETADSTSNANYKYHKIMTWVRGASTWVDKGAYNPTVGEGVNSDAWMTLYDKVADRLVRFFNGVNNGGIAISPVLDGSVDISQGSNWFQSQNPSAQPITVSGDLDTLDYVGRYVYQLGTTISNYSRGQLWRFHLDSHGYTRMADPPYGGGAYGNSLSNFAMLSWGVYERRLLYYQVTGTLIPWTTPTTPITVGNYNNSFAVSAQPALSDPGNAYIPSVYYAEGLDYTVTGVGTNANPYVFTRIPTGSIPASSALVMIVTGTNTAHLYNPALDPVDGAGGGTSTAWTQVQITTLPANTPSWALGSRTMSYLEGQRAWLLYGGFPSDSGGGPGYLYLYRANLGLSVQSTTLPPPTLTELVPNRISVGSQTFILHVVGTNFVSGASVRWNNGTRATVFVSATLLQATILATDMLGPTVATVTVVNPDSSRSAGLPFTVAFAVQTGIFAGSVM